MSDPVQFTAGSWNLGDTVSEIADRTARRNYGGAIQSHGFASKKHLKRSIEFINAHHKNVMEWNAANYGHETEFQTHLAGLQKDQMSHQAGLEGKRRSQESKLSEKAEASKHGRNLEFLSATGKMAKGSTPFSLSFPEGPSVSLTTKADRKRTTKKSTPAAAAAATPTPAPTPTKRNFSPVKLSEEPQQEGPAAPISSPSKKSGPSVGRDPKTGRATKLGAASTTTAASTPKSKKTTTATPTVVRDPKTGRARSAKKK